MWERACPQWWCQIQHRCWLTVRHRGRHAPTRGYIDPASGSAALGPTLAPVTGFLAFAKERLVVHHRFVRVFGLHMLDVVVVVGHADHQARSLAEVLTEATQVIEHGAFLAYASGTAWNGDSLSVRSLLPQAAMPTLSA